jgi:membrane fusion protein
LFSKEKPLFREEALDAMRSQPIGQIELVPGISSAWLAIISLLVLMGIAALATMAAPQTGTVLESFVRDGQMVDRGAVLFVLSSDRMGDDSSNYQQTVSAQVQSRRQSLEGDIKRSKVSEEQEADQLHRRLQSLRTEQEQVSRSVQQLDTRARALEETFKRYEILFKQDFVSKDEFLTKQNELNEMRMRQQQTARDLLVLERDVAATQRDLETLRGRYNNQRSEFNRAVLSTRQEYSELEAKRRIVVTAPANGKISLVQVAVGQSVEAGKALVQIVPAGSRLLVRLLAPSRSAGFIQVGEPVLLRFDAFPYQKYGQLNGKVETISMTALDSTELQANSVRAESSSEPVFSVTVSLPEKPFQNAINTASVAAPIKLQAGMKVEADLLHETRRIYEWILEPLFAAKSRIVTP